MPGLVGTGIYQVYVPGSCGAPAVTQHHEWLLAQQGIEWKASLMTAHAPTTESTLPLINKHVETWASEDVTLWKDSRLHVFNALLRAIQDRIDNEDQQEGRTRSTQPTSYTGAALPEAKHKARWVAKGFSENQGDYEVPDDSSQASSSAAASGSIKAVKPSKAKGTAKDLKRNFNNAMKKASLAFSPREPFDDDLQQRHSHPPSAVQVWP